MNIDTDAQVARLPNDLRDEFYELAGKFFWDAGDVYLTKENADFEAFSIIAEKARLSYN